MDAALPTPEAQSGTAGLSSAATLRYGLMGFALVGAYGYFLWRGLLG